jgi:hypothetical protein
MSVDPNRIPIILMIPQYCVATPVLILVDFSKRVTFTGTCEIGVFCLLYAICANDKKSLTP